MQCTICVRERMESDGNARERVEARRAENPYKVGEFGSGRDRLGPL